jgi:hypothetical protein
MPLAEGQFQVRGLVMGPGTPYRLMDDTNTLTLNVRADQGGKRAWGHGGWSGAEWADEKVVPLRLLVDGGGTVAGLIAAQQQLAAAFAPVGDSAGDVELRYALGGAEYVLFGRPRMVEPETQLLGTGRMFARAAFVALDPHVYSADVHQVQLGLPSAVGGLLVPRGPALNSNPFFEAAAAPWTAIGGGTVSRSTAEAHEGTASLLLTPDGVGTAPEARSENVPATVGVTYQGAGWVKCAVARNITVGINWRDAGAVLLSSTTAAVPVAAATWTRVVVRGTAPASTAQAQLLYAMGGTPPGSNLLWIDEAELRSENGATVGLTAPVTVGAVVTAGRTVLVNAGTAEVGLRLRIDGPVDQPRVSLLTGDGVTTLRLGLTVTTGQWVDVDTAARTVYLNGTASRRGQASGGWPVLPRGGGEIAFDAVTYNPAAMLAVSWRDAWV